MNIGKTIFFFSFLSINLSAIFAQAQQDTLNLQAKKDLKVALYAQPPYVIQGENGTWDGISLRLWRAVADTLNLTYTFVEVDPGQSTTNLLSGKADVVLLGDVTSKAEAVMDFSHIYHKSELGLATADQLDLSRLAKAFFNKRFWNIAMGLAILFLIVGLIIYLVERKSNEEQFGGDRAWYKGIGSGFWWAGVTMTTIGYGDKAPVTFFGRAVALIWMLIAMALTAVLTASLVSVVMGNSGAKNLNVPDDLRTKKVAAVENSSASEYLNAERISFQAFPNISEALKAVNDGGFDAVFHTVPALKYHINNDPDLSLRVQPVQLDPKFFAFGIPSDDPLREQINLALLNTLNTALWQKELDRFVPQK